MAKRRANIGGKGRLWRGRIRAWAGSGESQAEYCRRHGLKRALFVYWKRRLQEKGTARRGRAAIQLVEVPTAPLSEGSGMASGIAVVAAGWRVELQAGFDEKALRRVLGVLQASL